MTHPIHELIRRQAKAIHDKLFRSFERVTNSGPLAYMAMGMMVDIIRKKLNGPEHADAPRNARIMMFGVDIVEEQLRGHADEGTSECMAMAAMYYMISVEPDLEQGQRDMFNRLMNLMS